MQGIAIPFTMQGVQMKGTRVDAEFQGNKIIDITTPTKGWSQNPFGGKATLSPISDDELKPKLDDLDIQDAFIDYKTKGSTVEFFGINEVSFIITVLTSHFNFKILITIFFIFT